MYMVFILGHQCGNIWRWRNWWSFAHLYIWWRHLDLCFRLQVS